MFYLKMVSNKIFYSICKYPWVLSNSYQHKPQQENKNLNKYHYKESIRTLLQLSSSVLLIYQESSSNHEYNLRYMR